MIGVDPNVIAARAYRALKPPRRLPLSEWADEYFRLSAESAAEPGPWRTLPYQKGIMDAITDPSVTQVSLMKSARVGYTKIINATVGYYIHQDPCPIMVVQPTIDDAQGYSKEEIAPMLRDCEVLSDLVAPARARDSNNTILLKRFAGGLLGLVGANSARGFRRVSRKVVIFDETDGYPPSAGSEGDQIKLGIRRTDYYWDRKIVAGSTPTIAGISRIEKMFLAGDQRRRYVPCPHCHRMQVLQFKGFSWPKGHPERAIYVCQHCGAEIEDRYKRAMDRDGEWRPGPHAQFPNVPVPAPFSGHASFHIWAAYSYSPNASWGQLCVEFVAAERGGGEELKTFVNTVLGETWIERGDAPDWERLKKRAEPYKPGTVPRGALFLTAGVDVQKDRLVVEVVGWGRGKESWSVDWLDLPGDTSDLVKGPWPNLAELLARNYQHEGGADMPIVMLAVDSGFNTNTVYTWTRGYPMNRVMAVKGQDHGGVLVGAPTPVEVTIQGKKRKRGARVWPVNVSMAKTDLYGWLGLEEAKDEGGLVIADAPLPPGWCHFPQHYGDRYFQELTAEHVVTYQHKNGTVTRVWEPIPGRQNHTQDARNYARFAASVFGLDRFRESDWVALEQMIGSVQPIAVAALPPVSPPRQDLQASVPAPSAPQRRPNWLGRRPSNWLKGRR